MGVMDLAHTIFSGVGGIPVVYSVFMQPARFMEYHPPAINQFIKIVIFHSSRVELHFVLIASLFFSFLHYFDIFFLVGSGLLSL